MRHYSAEPKNPARYTARRALLYTWVARPYDVAVRLAPVWRTWLLKVLPAVRGPRVLEVSVGTGYLLTQYPREIEVHGLDIAEGMVQTARRNARRAGTVPRLVRADVAALPYIDGAFDSVVSTMAFTGYADGVGALAEMTRVLRPGGRLVMLDVNYPVDGNWGRHNPDRVVEMEWRCHSRHGSTVWRTGAQLHRHRGRRMRIRTPLCG